MTGRQRQGAANTNSPGFTATARTAASGVRLSKSRIAAFEHCPKRLWLQCHQPSSARIDEQTRRLFASGHALGDMARLAEPDGVLVDEDHRNLAAAIARTRLLTRAWRLRPVFEGAFVRDSVVIRADILQPDGWGGWRLVEVKNSASVKPYQLRDVATQAWVLRASGLCISSMVIRHVHSPLRTGLPRDVRFVDAEVTEAVNAHVFSRSRVIDSARRTGDGPMPVITMGRHCTYPFRCEFRDYCAATPVVGSPPAE